jgi:hypothetical protein
MVAIAYTDISTPAPAPVHTVNQPTQAAKKQNRRPAGAMSDPVVDVTTRLLSVPLHQAYALLWRAGLLSVDD